MDLGLKQLSDDQLVDLLQQACQELGQRAGFVRDAAQQVICTEAEKMLVFKSSLQKAVIIARQTFIAQLDSEVREIVCKGVEDGSIRLVSVDEETAEVARTSRETLLQLSEISERDAFLKAKAAIETKISSICVRRGWTIAAPPQDYFRRSTDPRGNPFSVFDRVTNKNKKGSSPTHEADPSKAYGPAY